MMVRWPNFDEWLMLVGGLSLLAIVVSTAYMLAVWIS